MATATAPPVTNNWLMIGHLDFEPEQDPETCEYCDKEPTWRVTLIASCPHDGESILLCDPCKEQAQDKVNSWIESGCSAGCLHCDIVAELRWERL